MATKANTAKVKSEPKTYKFKSWLGSWEYPFLGKDKTGVTYSPYSLNFNRDLDLTKGMTKSRPYCWLDVAEDAVFPKEAGELAGTSIVDFIKSHEDFKNNRIFIDKEFESREEKRILADKALGLERQNTELANREAALIAENKRLKEELTKKK